jgi:hypothetical protein
MELLEQLQEFAISHLPNHVAKSIATSYGKSKFVASPTVCHMGLVKLEN